MSDLEGPVPVNVRGRTRWDTINTPESAFRTRIAELRHRLDEADVSAAVIYSRGVDDGALTYLTNLVNFIPKYGKFVVVLPDEVRLIHGRSSRSKPILEQYTWLDDIQFPDDMVSASVDAITGSVPGSRTIGIAGFRDMPHADHEAFKRALDAHRIEPVDDLLARQRFVKTARERDQIERAARIATDVLESITGTAGTETELAVDAAVDRRARLQGAQDVRLLLSSSTDEGTELRPARDGASLRPDSTLAVYLAVRYEGYWAELARTMAVGQGGELTRFGESPDETYRQYIDAIEIGETMSTVRGRIRDRAATDGLELAPTIPLGNAIGTNRHDRPTFEDGVEIERSGTLGTRLPVIADDGRLLLHGDTVAVGTEGVELLTAPDRYQR